MRSSTKGLNVSFILVEGFVLLYLRSDRVVIMLQSCAPTRGVPIPELRLSTELPEIAKQKITLRVEVSIVLCYNDGRVEWL